MTRKYEVPKEEKMSKEDAKKMAHQIIDDIFVDNWNMHYVYSKQEAILTITFKDFTVKNLMKSLKKIELSNKEPKKQKRIPSTEEVTGDC